VRSQFRLLFGALAGVVGLLVALVGPAPAQAAPTWAPEATATIHPGVQTDTAGGQCTANFIFTAGADVYIGQAAHCSGTGGQTETDGCLSGSLPLGTPVTVEGASRPGTMVYNSWLAMQAAGETDPNACAYNDLALVRLDPADVASVNPTVPHWGGPVGVDSNGTTQGERVYSYGNSSLRLGLTQLSPKTGISLGAQGGGWTHLVYTVSPGIPGDSGSAFLDATGRAVGVLSTLQVAPVAASNGVSDISRMVAYARSHDPALADLTVVNGTRAFNGSRLPLGV
jgi:hypothetical protein